jgi:membrane protease YdiL (CAAX protease family)
VTEPVPSGIPSSNLAPLTRVFVNPRGESRAGWRLVPLRVFVNAQGEVRAGWRLLLYVALVVALAAVLVRILAALHWLPSRASAATLRPGLQSAAEAIQFLVLFVPALIMGRLERRPIADYGLGLRRHAGRNMLFGLAWGLVLISVVIGGIALFHGYDFGRLSLSGAAIAEYGLAWFVGFVLVGLFEEFWFRGYTQFTLATGIGFWPAAVVLSIGFGAIHLQNPGEGLVGALQVFLVAMFFCLTLRRTGSLWFAIGTHTTFDWGETFLYSVPNSGLLAVGHLSAASLHGGRWLTGGTVGPEGSVICFLALGASIVLFAWVWPAGAVMDGAPHPLA